MRNDYDRYFKEQSTIKVAQPAHGGSHGGGEHEAKGAAAGAHTDSAAHKTDSSAKHETKNEEAKH